MNSEQIIVRELQSGDIENTMKLVRSEGWNQTEKDWLTFIENPLNICRAAEICGKLVGTVTSINYGNEVAWISMVLVNKEYRGRGISKILLNSVIKDLEFCKSIKLDATPAGQPVYQKLGFSEEYLISDMVNNLFRGIAVSATENIPQLVTNADIPEIIQFDKLAFGSDRTQLILSLVKDFPEKSWLIKRDNNITGFALGRKGNKYHRIGPVSALTAEDAKILISRALNDLHGQPVVMDILDSKKELADWLGLMGFVKLRYFTRMYLHNNIFPGKVNFQHLIGGPEFG